MESIKVGMVVQLKSGGPKMTVSKLRQDGKLDCDWFAGTNIQSEAFISEVLKIVDETKRPAPIMK